MDVTEYKALIEAHQQKMASHLEDMERFESWFENKLKHAKIYPTWAVVVFIMAILLSITLVIYNY